MNRRISSHHVADGYAEADTSHSDPSSDAFPHRFKGADFPHWTSSDRLSYQEGELILSQTETMTTFSYKIYFCTPASLCRVSGMQPTNPPVTTTTTTSTSSKKMVHFSYFRYHHITWLNMVHILPCLHAIYQKQHQQLQQILHPQPHLQPQPPLQPQPVSGHYIFPCYLSYAL